MHGSHGGKMGNYDSTKEEVLPRGNALGRAYNNLISYYCYLDCVLFLVHNKNNKKAMNCTFRYYKSF